MSFPSFSSDFTLEEVRKHVNETRMRNRDIFFESQRTAFEENVRRCFVEEKDFSTDLVVPREYSSSFKFGIAKELQIRFPDRVEIFKGDIGSNGYWLRLHLPTDANNDERPLPTSYFSDIVRFRIMCK